MMDKMGKDDDVSRAVVQDGTALLLAVVDNINKAALGRLRNGSDAARILDQDMSNRLLHLACRHDAVECARLLLDGEYRITPASVDARDQLTRTPLHVAAEAHSKRCIQLLLSTNARTDVRLLDGTRLVALEIALMSRRIQVDWSPDNSVEDLLAYLQQKDLNTVRLLAEKTREVGEVAYRYAVEGRAAALAMLLLVAVERISAMVSVVIDGVRTKRSIYHPHSGHPQNRAPPAIPRSPHHQLSPPSHTPPTAAGGSRGVEIVPLGSTTARSVVGH